MKQTRGEAMNRRENREKRRAQTLLEFITLLAAFLALVIAFTSFAAQARKNAENVFSTQSLKQSAEALCFLIDYFALDGRNTAFPLDFTQAGAENLSLSGGGRELVLSKNSVSASATCHASIRSLENLEVEQNEFEPT